MVPCTPASEEMFTIEPGRASPALARAIIRSEEHTSELQSLMRHSSAVFFLKTINWHNAKTKYSTDHRHHTQSTFRTKQGQETLHSTKYSQSLYDPCKS